MPKFYLNNRGLALVMVLGTLLVVAILANVILALIASQSRLTHHQVSRIRAYYASQAGMNLALEQLRTGVWRAGTYSLCSSSDCDVIDSDIPYRVNITISPPNATGIHAINITTSYTYTP